jgi:hypothetical protein
MPQSHQQVQRRRMEIQPELIHQGAVVAEAIALELPLQLLIPVLALAPLGRLVLHRLR